MAKLSTTPDGKRIPRYCHLKPSGRAYVRINGKHIPLGAHDSSEGSPSMELHRRMIAEWRANGYRTPSLVPGEAQAVDRGVTVRELTAWFLSWAEEHYSRSEFLLCRQALSALCGFYGTEPVTRVGLVELRVVREQFHAPRDDDGDGRVLARKTVNALISRIQRTFRNAASEGLISAETAVSVCALKRLKSGRTTAPDYAPRTPAIWKDVEKMFP